MGRPRKWADDTERRQAQNDRRKAARATKPVKSARKFVAIDGEGTGEGRKHRYVLLGIGAEQIENPGGLGFGEISAHLWQQFLANPDAIFCGFFLGYDFCQYLRKLPVEKAYRLFHPEVRERRPLRTVSRETGEVTEVPNRLGPWPVTYQGWEFDILGMKRFKLRPEGARRWIFVCDAGPFYQASLLSVIDPDAWEEPIVTQEEYQKIREGKEKRDSAVLDSDMRYYNALENEILANRLLPRLDAGLQRAGVRLGKDQWFGPGQAAQSWLTHIRCPTGEMVRNAIPKYGPHGDILHKGRMTYYGGWFEIFAHGHIPGHSWEYDINSAYPFIASRLPCLLHGRWENDDSDVCRDAGTGTYRIVNARVLGSDSVCGTMLHRREDHSIVRPLETQGWYWESELAAGIRAGVIDRVDIFSGVRYHPCECAPPLRGLAGLYDERLRVGKNTPEGKALKLIYNSVYGKFAQSIGDPRYANSIYASLITSGCRAMILDAIASHPGGTNELLMVATDGVYFRNRHSTLPVGTALGQWEETRKTGLTLFKPGVYWDNGTRERIRDGHDPRFKSRGINAKAFASQLAGIDSVFSGWNNGSNPDYPSVIFTSGFSMITPLQALQRGKWELAGTLGHEPIDGICNGCSGAHLLQDSDPVQKRKGLQRVGDIWRSQPWETGGESIESTPYDRAFGQPDPDEYGITDDGTVLDSWKING